MIYGNYFGSRFKAGTISLASFFSGEFSALGAGITFASFVPDFYVENCRVISVFVIIEDEFTVKSSLVPDF